MKYHLGVIDLPYTNEKQPVTTGQVAQWLENKYHIMQTFAEAHEEDIANELQEALSGVMETIMLGGPMPDDPFSAANGVVEHVFKVFLDEEQMAMFGVEGIPTMAALEGISHRKGAKKGERRPSFIDTGLYQSAFKAWGE